MNSVAKKKPNKTDPEIERASGIAALLAEQAKSLAYLSALVADGFKTTNASLARLEQLLDAHAMATFEDFQELSGDVADLGDALDRLRDTALRNDRTLGDVEDAVKKIDRRSEADVKDLLKRVTALESAIKRSPHSPAAAPSK